MILKGRRARAGEARVVLSIETPADAATIAVLADAVEAHFIRSVHMRPEILAN